MKIAVEGCAHGELDNIYNTIKALEEKEGFKVDLLICCGDFQSSRNEADLRCMAVPPKYYNICSFYKYYNGEKIAPILTIFIGGNHEASNYLQELPYGGWVAQNIYYLGYAGVINIAGIRIGGISGIYKGQDYMKGHFEYSPYDDSSKRSVYHIRNLEVFRLKQISNPINIFLSHDWPSGVWDYGNKEQLLRFKPYFEDDMNSGKLGNKPAEDLLTILKPDYWFAAHLHCKFAAVIPHSGDKFTKFLALDKCLPKRRFLQIVDIPHTSSEEIQIKYDLEWLTILHTTNHLLNVKNFNNYMPGPGGSERWSFTPSEEENKETLNKFDNDLVVPNNFVKTANGYEPSNQNKQQLKQPKAVANPQTVNFCMKLKIDDPLSMFLTLDTPSIDKSQNICNTSLDDNSKTFIDDSDISINTVKSKFSMNLPEPIRNDNNIDLEEEICKDYKQVNSQQIDSEITDEPDTKTDYQVPTVNKTFKRRNASFYTSENSI